jgi:hypothetical protein
MSSARSLLVAALCVASPLALSACKTTKSDTTAPLAADDSGPVGGGVDNDVTRKPVPQGELVKVTVTIAGLDDVFEGLKKFGERWLPGQAMDPASDAQALLLGLGFGPGFWGNIDFSGPHSVYVAAPAEGDAGPESMELSGSLAVFDVPKLLESTPSEYRPQPLGDKMWEYNRDGERMLMRDAGKELLVGYTTADLDRAAKLRGQAGEGRRFRARATNIPVDQFDPVSLLGLPRDLPMVQAFSEVLKELEAFELQAEFGSTRDAELVASAQAPFHKLGLGPIGQPRAAATGLEGRLPANPVFVTTMSWGDPKLIHTMMDKSIPVGAVPAPFDKMVSQAIASMHALLDEVSDDVVLAMYVDKQGRATLLFAADVKATSGALEGVRGLNDVIVQGVDAQKALTGKDTKSAFDAKLAKDKLKIGSARADQLTVTIPASFEEDFEAMSAFLTKNKLESFTMVHEGTAVVAIGAGAKALISDVGRSLGKDRRDSLAQHDGLGRLRKAMGGCQICVSGDPTAYFRFRLMHVRDTADDKKVAKAASGKLGELDKTADLGDPGLGLRVAKADASLAVVVPQSLVFAPVATTEKFSELAEFLSDPSEAAVAAPVR